jgi:hypothetical protein
MLNFPLLSPHSLAAPRPWTVFLVAASFFAAIASAQTSPAGPVPPAPVVADAATTSVNTAMLAKATKLYFSSKSRGLTGFDCSVHPDWRTLYQSAKPGTTIAEDDPELAMLKSVNITLHGRLAGGSTLDWNPPVNPAKPLEQGATDTLNSMHQAVERTLLGFMQFWSPFVDGSVIPATADGLDITSNASGHTLHADQGTTSLTEVLDNNLVMQQFNVVMSGAKINFSPRYKATDQGLLVNGFLAHIQGPSTPADQAEEMHVEIDYQSVGGTPIPSKIDVEVSGQGKLNFALDGCDVNPK